LLDFFSVPGQTLPARFFMSPGFPLSFFQGPGFQICFSIQVRFHADPHSGHHVQIPRRQSQQTHHRPGQDAWPCRCRGPARACGPAGPGRPARPPEAFAKASWIQFTGFRQEIKDYDLIARFPALTEIRFLRGNVALEGIARKITRLVVDNAAIQIPERSARFHGFDSVRITPLSASDAAAIAGHGGLKELSVTQALDPVIDTSDWGRLTRLERLFAASAPFSSLEFLGGLTSLADFQAMNLGMTSLDPLRGRDLKRLHWTELNVVQDMRGIEQFTGLEDLVLYQRLPSLDILAGMTGMVRLKVQADRGDLHALAEMRGLEEAELSVPPGTDLSPLAGLDRLKRLMLSFNDGSEGVYLKTRKAVRERFGG
jgi:hypothetical protein